MSKRDNLVLCKCKDWSLDLSTCVTNKTGSLTVATPALSGVEMGIVGVCWASGEETRTCARTRAYPHTDTHTDTHRHTPLVSSRFCERPCLKGVVLSEREEAIWYVA